MMSRGRMAFMALSLTTVLLVASGKMLADQSRRTDDGKDSLYKYLAVFSEVLSLVDRAYVDELETETLLAGAFEGTLDALDPFSVYVPAAHVDEFLASRDVGIRRSGLLVLKERGVAYAAAIEPGSPAAEAGIERGDIIAAIQQQRTRKIPLFEIHSILAGDLGAEIEIERIRQGQKEASRFRLAEYPPPGLELTTSRGIGVLRLPGFHSGTAADVEAVLETLRVGFPGLSELTVTDKLVVDLRAAAGGAVAAAYQVAGLFAAGDLGALQGRGGEIETFDGGDAILWQGDIVVLLDRGTQGASEVLATVLKQAAGATLVGDRSFGHCGRQSLIEMSNGDRLQITDAFYTGPDREPIDDSLQPDLWIRPGFLSDEPGEDEVLERGLKVLLGEEEVEERQAA